MGTLQDAKALMAGHLEQWPTQSERAAQRRARHTAEIEESQSGLRKSIAETNRLVSESETMLRRHHKECDEDVA